ncbi:hypothetical protein MPER_11037 [Moniliophthora perniciosa FA553]|nr:hypothetical protein MPER_11037 [Moniliophthora perniciosa FA553]
MSLTRPPPNYPNIPFYVRLHTVLHPSRMRPSSQDQNLRHLRLLVAWVHSVYTNSNKLHLITRPSVDANYQ